MPNDANQSVQWPSIAVKADGADVVVFGPIFETPGKGSPIGLAEIRDISGHVAPFPVIGLGGIDAENCGSVIAAGASGIAAIRSSNNPDSLRMIVQTLRK